MLIDNKKWIAFFSHTGNEIYNISKELGRYPDRVITNKSPDDSTINKKLARKVDMVYVSDRPTVQDYDRVIWSGSVITLHGWMRIVPEIICDRNEIYNLHPGLITKYPELKGKDPQKRVAECTKFTYSHVGCVIHRVIPQVDEGKVLAETSTRNDHYSEQMLTDRLHSMAQDLWVDFINLTANEKTLQAG